MPNDEPSINGTISSITSSLLSRVRHQEDEAWDQLVDTFAPLVFLLCRREGLQKQDSLDVGQEVWRAVFANIGRFQRTEEHHTFRGWLRTITINKIRDHYRRKGATLVNFDLGEAATESPSDSDSACVEEETRALFDEIVKWIANKYREHNWRAFLMVAAEGMDREDVARELGINRNQVDLAVSRIRDAIRREFGSAGASNA